MSVLGVGGLLKPFRCLGSRLFASNNPLSGAKSVGNDQHHVFPSQDADCGALDASSVVSSGCFVAFPNDDATHLPATWPMQGIFNDPSCQPYERLWFDMKLHQFPVAAYHRTEALPQLPSGHVANNFVMLQPVLIPVFHPFWGMHGSAETQPTVSGQLATTMVPQEVTEAALPQQRRSRRGEAATRKKLAGAVCPEEVEVWRCAGMESEPVMIRGRSGSERWSDYEVEDNSSQIVASTDTSDVISASTVHTSSAQLQSTPTSTSEEDGLSEAAIDPLLLELDSADEASRQFALDWVAGSFWPLALTKRGCRIVQKAIDVGTPAYQHQLVENLHGRVNEAIKSPHTNYVLQKFIEIMPPERMQFVLTELQGQGRYVSRHRFGCRIIQRLIEHCPPSQTESLINEILCDAAPLCRHQYGNFIVQHILQHGSPVQRSAIAEVVEADIIRLAKHRIASHVVSSAMVNCAVEDVQRLTHTVLHDVGKLADLSRREYGSFVVREVNRAARNLRSQNSAIK